MTDETTKIEQISFASEAIYQLPFENALSSKGHYLSGLQLLERSNVLNESSQENRRQA
jgi:hypothetical protein